MKVGLCIDARFRGHQPTGQHPERPARIAAIEALLDERGLRARALPLKAREATRTELERAHSASMIDGLARDLGHGGSGWLDADTFFSPGTWEAALLAAGTAVDAAEAVASGSLDGAALVVRPPGHHATRGTPMGFCLLNNAAVAAAALAERGVRVAIVDFDVHHGNGTQDIFWSDGRVLYASTHQFPFYPGTGAVTERGAGAGLGATINVPLPAGTTDEAFLAAYGDVILPALERFRPDVLIASAGFDAHIDDPLGELCVTTGGFAELVARLRGITGGRMVMLLEGGYDLGGLSRSFAECFGVMLGDAPSEKPLIHAEPEQVARRHPGHALASHDEERQALAAAARSLAELPPPAP